jgi:ABC-2 type transport system ATP-binding protein
VTTELVQRPAENFAMIIIYRGIRGYLQRRAALHMEAAAAAPINAAGLGPAIDPDAAISVRGLRMSYGPLEAVRGIDLDVRRGEIVAFLGPNGAGKTTTVEILEGYRRRTGGEVRVLGEDPGDAPLAWRDRIGVVLQESSVEPDLTAAEVLALYAGYHARPRPVMETLELVGLADRAGARGRELSGGQRRRLEVAIGLIGDPELLFLDEPTTGFDPAARRQSWEVIAGLRRLGTTIFLTTHYMDEAEALADRIVVISQGRIVAEGTPHTLAGRDARPATLSFRLSAPAVGTALPASLAGRAARNGDGRVRVSSTDPLADTAALASWAASNRLPVGDLEVRRPSLEEIYLELTEGAAA